MSDYRNDSKDRFCDWLTCVSTAAISGREDIWQQVPTAVTIERPLHRHVVGTFLFDWSMAKHGRRQARAGVIAQSKRYTHPQPSRAFASQTPV